MTMKDRYVAHGFMVVGLLLAAVPLSGTAEGVPLSPPPTKDRVPAAHSDKAKALHAPFGDTRTAAAEIVAAGKTLYEGKGACFLCHGVSGKGDGPASHMQAAHPPRNFTDCAFQKERDDGELFWIIKYGSPGTGMQALIPNILSEGEGWKVVAYLRTFCKG
ncbi:MAG: cytochrome c [Nitrospirae bacterium]|nr:cytochrome c [Nitrospirota bacterium]